MDAEEAGVFTLAVTTTPRASPRNHELAQRTKHVRAALGLHPQLVAERVSEIELWDRCLSGTRYVGQVGLDASPRFYKSLDLQKQVFQPSRLDDRLSHEQIAAALSLSKGVVTKYVRLAAAAGLEWAAVRELDEVALERHLLAAPRKPSDFVQPDYGRVHQELRHKGMTLMLLWEEHRSEYAGSQTYAYSQYCENYRRFTKHVCAEISVSISSPVPSSLAWIEYDR